ncbi:MAG: M23 family metallopeptidase [Parcubacteria group bacterium]|nr:M23 family metallopeptidase [Parcubacteria group bacterium]
MPLKGVGLFLTKIIGVPIYRLVLLSRRYMAKVMGPAKHRVAFFISNRYTVHVMMGVIVASVVFVNLTARDVRAEDFGQQSLLYELVAQDDSYILEVVEAGSSVVSLGTSSSYMSDTIVNARRHIDFNYLEESYVTSKVGEDVSEPARDIPERGSIETYVIESGDTLGGIAEKFGLSLSTILWANGLSYNSTIQPGDDLKILPRDGVLYTVRSGDTLSRIASQYSVDTDVIMANNGMSSANKLSIGDELLLPGGEPPSPVRTARSSASLSSLFTAPSSSGSTSAAVGGWVWPTDWRVITQYYGWRHTGLDIDGDYSTYSYAARGGVVIYSGWRSGYGYTVEIDHGDGFVTRYAHHSKIFVSVGETVSIGQALAQTGTTGRSTGTHLHFEIIRNGKFQNPLDYIR